MSERTFAWGDICDVNGKPYHIGDQFRLEAGSFGLPDFEAQLGPSTLLYFEVPPDDETETQYVSGRPKDPGEIGGWTHYKLRELTIHRGTRVSPAEMVRMIDAAVTEGSSAGDWWVDKARARVVELTGPDGGWIDESEADG